jgi:hypothetical protein
MITAKEYFDDARSSALELKRLEDAIAHARQKLIPRGHGQGDVISHGVHDPMEAVGEIIDAEKELVFRRAEICDQVDVAGHDRRFKLVGGVR